MMEHNIQTLRGDLNGDFFFLICRGWVVAFNFRNTIEQLHKLNIESYLFLFLFYLQGYSVLSNVFGEV